MSEIRECPKCGLISPQDTDECECGYPFAVLEQRRQIYDKEKEWTKAKEPWFHRTPRILITAVALTVLLPVGGWFGFHAYRMHLLKDTIADTLGRDLAITEAILKSELSQGNAGLPELCFKSSAARGQLIAELRAVSPTVDYGLRNRLIEYMSAENKFADSKLAFYNELTGGLLIAQNFYRDAARDFAAAKASPGSYEWNYFYQQMRTCRDGLIRAWGEAGQSADMFVAAYHEMEKAEQAFAAEIRGAGLAFTPMFQKYAQNNEKPARDTKETVSAGFSMLP